MTRPRVLFIAHNHPAVRPGGAEQYALELHRAMRESGPFESVLLAKGPDNGAVPARPAIVPAGTGEGEYFARTDGMEHDSFHGRLWPKTFHVGPLRDFLLDVRPDVVHVQHTLFLGYETLQAVRTTLPGVPIVHTLHEYLPICHRDGQMVRTVNGDELCDRQTPERCAECFPELSAADFRRRTDFVKAHLALVDMFLAPSRFLLERYADWGIPRDRLVLEEYGRLPVRRAPVDPRPRRDRFAFFGQLNPYKGADVLLEAARLVRERAADSPSRPTVRINGANFQMQRGVHRERLRRLAEDAGHVVEFAGPYAAEELPVRMRAADWVVVPSIWWENSPLVIQEAFAHGRPVICSDIGGMAEKVRHGVDGLHFRARDAADLARVMLSAAAEPGLWERLRSGIRPVHDMAGHVQRLGELYASFGSVRRSA